MSFFALRYTKQIPIFRSAAVVVSMICVRSPIFLYLSRLIPHSGWKGLTTSSSWASTLSSANVRNAIDTLACHHALTNFVFWPSLRQLPFGDVRGAHTPPAEVYPDLPFRLNTRKDLRPGHRASPSNSHDRQPIMFPDNFRGPRPSVKRLSVRWFAYLWRVSTALTKYYDMSGRRDQNYTSQHISAVRAVSSFSWRLFFTVANQREQDNDVRCGLGCFQRF